MTLLIIASLFTVVNTFMKKYSRNFRLCSKSVNIIHYSANIHFKVNLFIKNQVKIFVF